MRTPALAAAALLLWLISCAPPGTEATGSVYHRPEDRFFDVLTYNVALLPEPVSSTVPTVRAARMAPHLAGFDALVLQEAFIDGARERLIAELRDAYPYRGELVGRDGAGGSPLVQDGGILILSRWPIVRQATVTFGRTCSGTDCLGDKGVAYAAIRKGTRPTTCSGRMPSRASACALQWSAPRSSRCSPSSSPSSRSHATSRC